MPYKDSQAQKRAQQRHYQANKAAYVEAATKNRLLRRQALAKVVREAKLAPCADCKGTFHYCVMDFDHVSGEKRGNVGQMVNDAVPFEKLLAEIAKCEVVCANCHRLRTFDRQTDWYSGM